MGIGGYTTYSSGVFQVTGSASTNSNDGFQFVHQGLIGDSTIIARIDSQTTNTGWGGMMIRNSSSSTSRYARLYATSDSKNHIFFYYRTSDGGSPTIKQIIGRAIMV